ncbi:hypothetical protein JCM14469_07240 [Desulfatiferula olefinivorans]
MNRILSRLLVCVSALWMVQPAGPIVSIFYCMSTTPEQKSHFLVRAVLIWIAFLVFQMIFILFRYKPIGEGLSLLEQGKPCPDETMLDLARRNSRLPIQATVFYLSIILMASILNFFLYLSSDISLLHAVSIWGATIAGAIACPFMVLGAVSLITGENTELIAGELGKRGLTDGGFRIRIFPKLVACFISLSVGLAVWLGFSAYYTGINQTLLEMTSGNERLLTGLRQHITRLDIRPDDPRLEKELSPFFGDGLFFIADKTGRMIANPKGLTLDFKRWTGLHHTMVQGFSSGHMGSLYDNVNNRVISWMPLDDTRAVGLVSLMSDRLSRYTEFYLWSGFFIGVGFSVGLILGITNVLATSKSIGRAKRALDSLSEGEGDLKTRLAITSHDEVGELSRGFNLFADKLHSIVRKSVEKAVAVKHASDHFSGLSKSLNAGIIDLRQASQHATSQASAMNVELKTVSAGCEEAAESVNHMATAADEMALTVNEVAQKSMDARNMVDHAVKTTVDASARLSRLGSSARDIDKVTEVITDISDQTNLLALNATIEAARAGEAGKGFSVVANEIKELARQTSEATREIKMRVEGIQSATDETIHDMEAISTVVHSVNEIVTAIAEAVEEQSLTTREIAKNISQASGSVSDVNTRVGKSSDTSEGISDQMARMMAQMDDMAGSSSQIETGARDLLAISDDLNDQLSQFKL